MQNNPLKQISLASALTLAAFAPYWSQAQVSRVLVIDEGIDLSHPGLSARANSNATEAQGQVTVDDDKNGFVDDVAGWNAVSNDAEYFPARVRKVFVDNRDRAKELLDLYSAAQLGDMDAIQTLRGNPFASRAVSSLISVSHGTHVGGIVVKLFQKEAPFLQSYNVFTGSQPPKPGDKGPAAIGTPASLTPSGDSLRQEFMRQFAEILSFNPGPVIGPLVTAPPSAFDDINNFESMLEGSTRSTNLRAERLRAYLRAHPQGVVNLSLGFTRVLYAKNLNQLWMAELQQNGLDPKTPRTAAQEKVLQDLADRITEINKSYYSAAFAEFSDTLFVIAAGNDGDASVENAGNNEINTVWPANFSKTFANVITIAAVDDQGMITDFSNYGSTVVNVGAPGKNIKSTAPGGLEVVMSGTSMAAPYVTGLAARVRTLNGKLSAAQTRKILERTVRKVSSLEGKTTTGGLVDAEAAAQAAISSRDIDFDKAIDSTIRSRDIFTGRSFIMSSFRNLTSAVQGQSAETPKVVRDIMRSIFYK